MTRAFFARLAILSLLFSAAGCISTPQFPPDTVSEQRTPLISAAGGFVCLYRDGANTADLLYVKRAANDAGLDVIFRVAESQVIPDAVRKGWADAAIGFTWAEAKNFGLRRIPLPSASPESPREDAGSGIILVRSADEFLDHILNPNKPDPMQ